MNILLLQTDIVWQSPEANLGNIRRMTGSPCGGGLVPDLVILPEMFTTGFCSSPVGVAEKTNSVTMEWMRQCAADMDAAVVGSIATEDDGKYYNRLYFVKPDGSHVQYDKRHLFSVAGEDRQYTAGSERVIVEWRGVRILLQVCYDLRFPVFARNRGDYDMILYVANWPTRRIDAWSTLLRARAIENACYVAGVNRVGDDPGNHYSGASVLFDFKGRTLAAADRDEQTAVCGSIDMAALRDFRTKFPALADADGFTINR